jgi:quinoprotein glucose dehydrogenase
VITGSANGEGAPTSGAYGDIRAWDTTTGKLVWSFHTVPRPGEPGNETWPKDGWKNRSGTNAWGFLTVDVKRGIVYVPLGSPTSDFYGADRHGDGLFGNSLVALDAMTGKLKWYQQLVHHDLWDFDPAAAPILFEASVPAVAQITKMGILFAFDRVTGKPLYGMEERPVPQTTVPGEKTSPTQPFPLKPPPLSRVEFTKDEIYNLTPEHAAFCRELYEKNQMQPAKLYTPLGLEGNLLLFPSTLGGGGWGGISTDPSLGYLFTNVNNLGQWGHMEKKGDTYIRTSSYGAYARFWNRDTRVPCTNPHAAGDDAVARGEGRQEHRRAEPRRQHCHGGRPSLHRRDERQPVPRLRLEDRAPGVGTAHRRQWPHDSHHLSRQGRQAVRRHHGGWRWRLLRRNTE